MPRRSRRGGRRCAGCRRRRAGTAVFYHDAAGAVSFVLAQGPDLCATGLDDIAPATEIRAYSPAAGWCGRSSEPHVGCGRADVGRRRSRRA